LRNARDQKLASALQSSDTEVDSTKLPDRIAEAKRAIVTRARELFQTSGENFEEEQALDTAVCVFHALHAR
jgi:hypothetical protein